MESLKYQSCNKSFSVDLSEPKLLAGIVLIFHGINEKNPNRVASCVDHLCYFYKVQDMNNKTVLYKIQNELVNELLNDLIVSCAKYLKTRERNIRFKYEIIDFITQPCKNESDIEKFKKKLNIAIGIGKNKLEES